MLSIAIFYFRYVDDILTAVPKASDEDEIRELLAEKEEPFIQCW